MIRTLLPLLPKKLYCSLKRNVIDREEGLGTIEMIILVAVLVGLAVAFKAFAGPYFEKLVDEIPTTTVPASN